MENSIESDVGNQGSANSLHDLKTIITRLSSKKPRLLLSLLRKIIETIEIRFAKSLSGKYLNMLLNCQFVWIFSYLIFGLPIEAEDPWSFLLQVNAIFIYLRFHLR